MKQPSRFQPTRRALLFWTLFIGLGAVAGACMMLLDPTGKAMGMDAMLPYFQVLPFADVHVLRVDPGSERTLKPRADLVHCRLPHSYAFSARRRTIASMVASKFCLVLPREISKLSARRLMLKMALTPIS